MRALFLIFVVICGVFVRSTTANTCTSLDIRNSVTELEKLRNCTVINGFLQIVLMDSPDSFDNYSFPELREITEYLMVFRVKKLQSLGQLFPNLAVIRGHALMHNYALVLYEMELVEVKSIVLYENFKF